LKVAYLFSRYPVPSQTFCDTEMRALEAAGVEVEIYSCSPPTTSFRHGAEGFPKAPVFYAPPQAALELWEAAAKRSGRWPKEMIDAHAARFGARYQPERRALHAVYFSDLMRRRGVNHLHVHFANRATHAALFIDALGGPPWSFTAHAQDFLVDLGSDALLREMCGRAAFAVTVSEWSREILAEKCPDAAGKIHRLYNGLPLGEWPEMPPERDADERADATVRIFSVGRLIEFKGFDSLIYACAELKQRGLAFLCEIAGEGPLRGDLERLIAERGVGDCVRLIGLLPQAQIRERLAHCDIFALACNVDARGACDVLPTVILEAMAASRPVVSTVLAGVPEMVDDGQTGRLAPPGDIQAMADALAELAADPAMRRRCGLAGREKLRTQFSADAISAQLLELFQEAVRPSVPTPAPAPPEGVGIVCLLAQWPPANTTPEGLAQRWHAALPHLRARLPGLRLVALDCPARLSTETRESAAALVEGIEFLPDAMILESEWRECARQAHLMESWRGEMGGGVETGQFLHEARRALWLRHHFSPSAGQPTRLLCAVGAGALLCAFLLTRLGSPSGRTCFLAEAPSAGGLPGSTLRRLAAGFAGGWVIGERKLANGLGTAFRGDDLPAEPEIAAERLAETLKAWATERAGVRNPP
jgi:glycosyltransferase involved in cell wall biosynthesis